jgi:hypothetical protein
VLDAGAAHQAVGSHVQVLWDASALSFRDTMGTEQPRPPYIALAHELIHAYHNMRGEQPGHEVDADSTVLYEYLCVGLGPWENNPGYPITENAIRSSAGLARRECY